MNAVSHAFTLLLVAGAGAVRPPAANADVVISEIHFHPGPASVEQTGREFLELHNPTGADVNLSGWRITDGVSVTFGPEVVIPAGGYAVVAADEAAFAAGWPGSPAPVAVWDPGSTLSNRGERIVLENAAGEVVESLRYADEGDWAERVTETTGAGAGGWTWSSPADGSGHTLELVQPALPRDHGSNWLPSQEPGGTPGRVNSRAAADTAPLIADVRHDPPVPKPGEPVTVYCRLFDEAPGATATVVWRSSTATVSGPFAPAPMAPGPGGELAAVLPGLPDHTVVEFYIVATDGRNERTWPKGAGGGRDMNALFQFDSEPAPEDQLMYRLVLSRESNRAFQLIPNSSNRVFNMTLIAQRGDETDVRYCSGMRIRGQGSRSYKYKSLRIAVPRDNPLDDVSVFNLNPKFPYLQYLGTRTLQAAGMRTAEATPVQVRRNGVNYVSGGADAEDFGRWVRLEHLDDDLADRLWPLVAGNLYKKGRPETSLAVPVVYPAEPDGNAGGWTKENNRGRNDWSDLDRLLSTIHQTAAGHFVNANTASTNAWMRSGLTTEEYQTLNGVASLEQWARWLAVQTIMANTETNFSNGADDDYSVFIPDGGRAELIPHDLDTVFGRGDTAAGPDRTLFDMTERSGPNRDDGVLQPLLPLFGTSPFPGSLDFRLQYYMELRSLLGNELSVPRFQVLLHDSLAGWVPDDVRLAIESWFVARRDFILASISSDSSVSLPPYVAQEPSADDPIVSEPGLCMISEVLTWNTDGGQTGRPASGFVEIALSSSATSSLPLGGWSLTNDPAQPRKFVFPEDVSLEPGGYLVLHADADVASPGLHLGFALEPSGGELEFLDPAGSRIDFIRWGRQIPDRSIGRSGAGLSTWSICQATPDEPNVRLTAGSPASIRINEWLSAPGFRVTDEFLELYNTSPDPVALSGVRVTDDVINFPERFRFPPLSYLDGLAFLLLHPEGGSADPANPDELPFRLRSLSHRVVIAGAIGVMIDEATADGQLPDRSRGSLVDGGYERAVLSVPTPGLSNVPPPPEIQALLDSLRITAVQYQPAQGAEFEYVELLNAGDNLLDLSGVRFTNGIAYTFPEGVVLEAGESMVVARVPEAFRSLYGDDVLLAPGGFGGALDNSGETLALTLPAPWEVHILSFRYDPDWYPETRAGVPLTIRDPRAIAPGAWTSAASWHAPSGGSPGGGRPPVLTGPRSVSAIAGDSFFHQLTATRQPVSFRISNLPPGLSLEENTGRITGAPLAPGIWLASVSAANATGIGHGPLRFEIAASGPVAALVWDYAPPAAETGRPFAVSLSARDSAGRIVETWNGGAVLSALAAGTATGTLVFTEASDNNPDRFEITNITDRTIDTNGWRVWMKENDTGGPGDLSPFSWGLPPAVGPGEILAVSDNPDFTPEPFYFGFDFRWPDPAKFTLILTDATGTPVDVFVAGFSQNEVNSASFQIDGRHFLLREYWSGPGAQREFDENGSYRRQGSSDTSGASDWISGDETFGVPDSLLALPWDTGTIVSISPDVLPFAAGRWAGWLSLPEPVPVLRLTAFGDGLPAAESALIAFHDPDPDSDGDGLPDQWEDAFGFPASIPGDGTGDPDADGFTNAQEFAAGTHPFDPASRFAVESGSGTPGGYTVLSFPAAPGRLYEVHWSPDLSSPWQPVPGTSVVGTQTGLLNLPFRAPPESTNRAYYRVNVSLNP